MPGRLGWRFADTRDTTAHGPPPRCNSHGSIETNFAAVHHRLQCQYLRTCLTERLDRRVEIDGDYFGAERAIAPSTVGWGGVVRKGRTILGTAFLTITRIYEPQRLVSVLPSLYHERHIY